MGIIRALGEKRLRVPEDISVIGYDDTFYSEMISPPLTCISYNLKAYAQVIMETIMQIINKEETDKIKFIPTYLTVRSSCRELRESESVNPV
jgi:DNA-binding LacI/PurR family transcriptional regulator